MSCLVSAWGVESVLRLAGAKRTSLTGLQFYAGLRLRGVDWEPDLRSGVFRCQWSTSLVDLITSRPRYCPAFRFLIHCRSNMLGWFPGIYLGERGAKADVSSPLRDSDEWLIEISCKYFEDGYALLREVLACTARPYTPSHSFYVSVYPSLECAREILRVALEVAQAEISWRWPRFRVRCAWRIKVAYRSILFGRG